MNWANLAAMIIPMVASLIQMAEKAYEGYQGKGTVKKELVTEGLNTLTSGMTALSNGGQKNTWQAIGTLAPLLIDPLVSVMNSVGGLTGHGEIIDTLPDQAEGEVNTMGHN